MIPGTPRGDLPFHPRRVTRRRHPAGWIANMIVRLAIRLMVLAAIIGGFLIVVFSWLAELLLPVFHRGKHAHPARAVHDSA